MSGSAISFSLGGGCKLIFPLLFIHQFDIVMRVDSAAILRPYAVSRVYSNHVMFAHPPLCDHRVIKIKRAATKVLTQCVPASGTR